jgi:hypothetical protein
VDITGRIRYIIHRRQLLDWWPVTRGVTGTLYIIVAGVLGQQ